MNTATDSQLGIGLHENIAPAIYHAFDACNNSSLNTLKAKSPLHCKWERDHPCEQTEAMRVGSALHTLVLEPDLFEVEWECAGTCSAILKSGKNAGKPCGAAGRTSLAGAWFCGTHGEAWQADSAGDRTLTPDQWQLVTGMGASVHGNRDCKNALRAARSREVTAIWQDGLTGILCKARFDALGANAGIIVDIKTTTDASEDGFTRTIYDRGYHRQAAHYIAGAAALGVTITDYILIAVEKEPPYAVSYNRLTDEAIECGAAELRPLIELYSHCSRANIWPGFGVREIGIPAWKKRQIENTF